MSGVRRSRVSGHGAQAFHWHVHHGSVAVTQVTARTPVWGGHRQGARLHAGAASRQEATQLPRGGRLEIFLILIVAMLTKLTQLDNTS